jgi:hypothetical protein
MRIGVAFGFALAVSLGGPAHAIAVRTAPPRCLKVLKPLAADSVPASVDFAPTDCTSDKVGEAFRYDPIGKATRLARPVAAGDVVSVYPEFGVDMVMPGERLRLVVASGQARIEREVEALQSARPGQRLFVRTADGEILSVRYGRLAR